MTLKNIKANFKNYWTYFLSSSFSVFALYLFMSILYSKNIQDNLGGEKKFIIVFNMGAVMITLFAAFFIWYSNSFFIKSRKKEFATYMLLGMSKKQVSRLNFLENIIIMILSLVAGIILGLIFTKFFIMLLFYIMKVSAAVPFQWNIKALAVCLIVFMVIFLVITLHGAVLVRSSNLIDLFNASKKVEKGLKVSPVTIMFSIFSVIFLVYGYYLASEKLASDFTKAPLVVFLVVVGTILFFTSATSFIIYMNKKNEKKLFSGTKLISSAQLYYRYRGNAGTLSIISITTTIALCALVTCIGSYTRAEENSRYMRPMSVEYFNKGNADTVFNNVLKANKDISIKSKDSYNMININSFDPITKTQDSFYIINESTFDSLNKHENITRNADLKNSNDCFYIQIRTFVPDRKALNQHIKLNLGNKTYNLKITGTDIRPFTALDHFKQSLIVKDNMFNEMKRYVDNKNIISMTGIMLKNDFIASNFVSSLKNYMPGISLTLTFYSHYHDGLKLLGMLAFIGLFIGMLFIMATGSIIYLKMTMEASEDKNKFIMLRKVGVSQKEIKNAISKELRLLFCAPLLLAIINSFPAAKALEKMLSLKLMESYCVIIVVYAAVYCIYYFVTLRSYMKTISNN
jgi:putative ABC transport system permease protein